MWSDGCAVPAARAEQRADVTHPAHTARADDAATEQASSRHDRARESTAGGAHGDIAKQVRTVRTDRCPLRTGEVCCVDVATTITLCDIRTLPVVSI